MGKLLEVKEFDSIICNKEYRNDSRYRYLEQKDFDCLVNFIRDFSKDEEGADALEFMKISYKRGPGNIVSVKNYVGVIQLDNGLQIQILPKVDFGEKNDNESMRTKQVFLKMLRSMKFFTGEVFRNASLNVDRMNVYELFIKMYLQEVRKLVKQGLKSAYVVREDNQNFFKGKLLVGKQIRVNHCHKEHFFVSYDEYSCNRPENRLVKATLEKLLKLTGSAENAKEVQQLLSAFEMVESSINYQKDFADVIIDRNTKCYEKLMLWSRVFLLNKSFTTFAGATTSKALLFPMESVYESYVAQQMKRLMEPLGWDVRCQDKGYYLFSKPRNQFAVRPDIVMEKDGRRIILDTKWKRLSDMERVNYGISQADMYQMYAYSKKYNTSEIWLLYPQNDDMRGHAPIWYDSGDGTVVKVHFVDVDNIEDSLQELNQKLEMSSIIV